nr:Holliday junction resolvase RuvX [Terrisporobacter glycolicus]
MLKIKKDDDGYIRRRRSMLDGRIMGLDIGDKTIGVAVSDIMGLTAQGVTTIKRVGKKKDIEEIKRIISEKQVNKIVSGLPKNMNGTVGSQGEKVQKFCELLKEETNLPIEFWDERLSTVAAERSLIEGNVRRENRKKVIDMLAAVIILQGYLDLQRNF